MPDSVLIISPRDLERRQFQRVLSEVGYRIWEAKNAVQGLLLVLERHPDLVILDEEIPPLSAGDVIQVLRQITAAPVIVIGNGDEPEEVSLLDVGADTYEKRPVSGERLAARIRSLIRRRRGPALGGRFDDEICLQRVAA